MRVVLVNEFSDVNCPVTKLVYELGNELSDHSGTKVVQANLRTKYRPGGTRWQRVLSLVVMHLLMPFVMICQWLAAKLRRQRFCVLVTTLPPLLHWNLLLLSLLLRFRCVVWYQDAHPEIEARILRRKGFTRLAQVLTILDRWILSLAAHMVVLDDAMAELMIKTRNITRARLSIAPPWTAYVTPAKRIRQPSPPSSSAQPLRLIYAGNYGFAHDLKPFSKLLETLNPEDKSLVTIFGIGMNDASRQSFQNVFSSVGIKVETLPRVESFETLLAVFETADLGLVSLREDYAGIAAPSKAYTYVSQGLPILYSGPEQTLPDGLITEGLGFSARHFVSMIRNKNIPSLKQAGQVAVDPKAESIATLTKAVYES